MSTSSSSALRFRVDPAWTPQAIDKATAFELAKQLGQRLAVITPFLLPCLSPILDRLSPVRLGHGNRSLRAWGRNYQIPESDIEAIELLVNGYYQGTRSIGLPHHSFENCQALKDGIIKRDGDMFWLDEPPEEKNRPAFVLLPELYSSNDFVANDPIGKHERDIPFKARKRTKVLMVMHEHPEWTDTQIAKAVGCDRASLYRMKGFKEAKAALRAARAQFKDWNQGEGPWAEED